MRSVKTNRLDCKTGVNRANKHSLALCSSMVQALSKSLKSELFLVFSDACVGRHCHIGVNEICSFRKSSRIHTSSYSKLVSFYLQKLTNVEPHLPEPETWNRVLRCCYATPDRKHASSTRRATPDEVNQEKSTEIHQVDITQNVQNIWDVKN